MKKARLSTKRIKEPYASIISKLERKKSIVIPIDRGKLFYLRKIQNNIGTENMKINPMVEITLKNGTSLECVRRLKNYKVFHVKK